MASIIFRGGSWLVQGMIPEQCGACLSRAPRDPGEMLQETLLHCLHCGRGANERRLELADDSNNLDRPLIDVAIKMGQLYCNPRIQS